MQSNHLSSAFTDSLPALFAYLPLGIVFGVLFHNLDLPWFLAPLSSLILYAGSVQFITIGILIAQGSMVSLFSMAFFIAFRNSFYGIHLLDRYQTSFWKKTYLIFGLIDSTYSTVINRPKVENEISYFLFLTGFTHSYWVLGTFIGAFFGNDSFCIPGLEFSLTALFTVFFIDQWKNRKDLGLVITAIGGFTLGYLISPDQAFLFGLITAITYPILHEKIKKQAA